MPNCRAILASAVILSGCAVGPRYDAPAVAVPDAFQTTSASNCLCESKWWAAFGDATLSNLIDRAMAQNLDVQQAASRVRQARLQARIIRGSQEPQINASAQGGSTRLSKNALPAAFSNLFSGTPTQSASGSGLGLPGETFTTYQAGFDASWELDFFGANRHANEGAEARVDAAVWSARDAQIMLAAEVAKTYEECRGLQRRDAMAEQQVANKQEALAFSTVQVKHGLVPDSDRRQKEQSMAQAVAQREEIEAQAGASRHALATLLNEFPHALDDELSRSPQSSPLIVEVPPGLPSELLQRRPDLRMAERNVAAATADTGVATADLYPKFSLTGAVQLASRSLSTLVESDSLQDNVAARVSLPIFNRDRLHATVELRQAQVDEAIIVYRKDVLSALRDVEDALTRLDSDRRRLEQFQISTRATRDAADSADVRFRRGLIAETESLTARDAWQSASDAEVQIETSVAQDTVALFKALGGGWQTSNPENEEKQDGEDH
jgi:NodT family efflux transporter outer membrane factor (OMF) lipoprotein